VRSNRTDDLLAQAGLFGVTLWLYWRTLAPGLTWRNDGADGGDLITAAASFGIPHPSGYPTYMLLARAFLMLPAGSEAYRLNLMSAVCAAAAVAICYRLCLEQSSRPPTRAARAGAAVAALLLGFSPLVWSQATITEVYTLHLLFVTAVFLTVVRWHHHHQPQDAAWAGLLLGLGLGNHLTLVLILPALMLYFSAAVRRRLAAWHTSIGAWGGSLCLGLGVYLYLPVASRFGTNLHWGRIDSPISFINHVGGTLYHGYLFALPPAEIPNRLLAIATLMVTSFQPWGLVVAGIGYLALSRADRIHALSLALMVVGSVIFAVGYNTTDSVHYLLPVWLMAVMCVAAGVESVSEVLSRSNQSAFWPQLVALTFAVFTLGPAIWRFSEFDLSGDDQVEQFSRGALAALPAEAIVLSHTDRQTFALWYLTEVRRVRSDVVVVDRDLLAYDPYRRHLMERWPALQLEGLGSTYSVVGSDGVQHPLVQLPE
jgi:hypothetical protein